MSTVLVYDADKADPTAREDRLSAEIGRTYNALLDALEKAGIHRSTRERDRLVHTPIGQALNDYQLAEINRHIYAEGRIQKLERMLRAALASDGLTDEQRASILQAFKGRDRALRLPHVLSATERELITEYRRVSDSARGAIRALVSELAKPGAPEPAAERQA